GAEGAAGCPRPTGRGKVLARRFDRDPEHRPLGRPLEVPGQLRVPAEGRDPATLPAAAGPRHERLAAFIEDPLAIPFGDDGRPDLSAVRADHAHGVPRRGMTDVGDALIDLPNERGPIECDPDEWIHLAEGVEVAHPVVAVRPDAETGERFDEDPGVVPRVGRVAVT